MLRAFFKLSTYESDFPFLGTTPPVFFAVFLLFFVSLPLAFVSGLDVFDELGVGFDRPPLPDDEPF